jgi:hypothetical protein
VEQYPTWESARRRLGCYKQRHPEESALYRLIYHYREEFEYRWEELFQNRYGVLRREVLDAFDRYLNCGILLHGAARAHCEKCNYSILIAFSCKRRGLCPSCQAKRAVLFAEHLKEHVLLPHRHRHLIFTIPKRLRIYFRFDRRLFSLLYHAAWETWSEYVAQRFPGGSPAAVMALHSAGKKLNWHPHIHSLALDGVVADDGAFLPLAEVDAAALTRNFAEKVLGALLRLSVCAQVSLGLL